MGRVVWRLGFGHVDVLELWVEASSFERGGK
jgi:hypothetical protein